MDNNSLRDSLLDGVTEPRDNVTRIDKERDHQPSVRECDTPRAEREARVTDTAAETDEVALARLLVEVIVPRSLVKLRESDIVADGAVRDGNLVAVPCHREALLLAEARTAETVVEGENRGVTEVL